jgi:Putative prokaryotic signal transducing protein
VYCSECGTEYRAEFTECADCGARLVAQKPEEIGHADRDLDLVTVFEASDPVLIASAKEILDEAGIPFYLAGEELLLVRIGMLAPPIDPWCRVQVTADRQEEARTLLQEIECGDPPSDVEAGERPHSSSE